MILVKDRMIYVYGQFAEVEHMATDSFDRNLIPMETSLQNSVLSDQVMDNLQIQNILQWIQMEMFTLVIGSITIYKFSNQ